MAALMAASSTVTLAVDLLERADDLVRDGGRRWRGTRRPAAGWPARAAGRRTSPARSSTRWPRGRRPGRRSAGRSAQSRGCPLSGPVGERGQRPGAAAARPARRPASGVSTATGWAVVSVAVAGRALHRGHRVGGDGEGVAADDRGRNAGRSNAMPSATAEALHEPQSPTPVMTTSHSASELLDAARRASAGRTPSSCGAARPCAPCSRSSRPASSSSSSAALCLVFSSSPMRRPDRSAGLGARVASVARAELCPVGSRTSSRVAIRHLSRCGRAR